MQTLSPHTAELDVGVPARGLHGEGYRGHVFWDELFVLPYITLHFPEVAREVFDGLPAARRTELAGRLGLDQEVLERWEDVSRRMYVPFHQGVISQFDGYGELAELDWEAYRARYCDIRRLDRILESEGDTVNRYQASKQADTLMLGYLFRPDDLRALFARLGYRLDDDLWRATVTYYLNRTSHGSTLSSLVHGWVLARQKGPEAWRYCEEALLSDVNDIQGGTTGEGIHLGAMAGTLDLVERGVTGLETGPDGLRIDPVPLAEVPRSAFTVSCRGHRGIRVRFLPGRLGIQVPASPLAPPLPVRMPGGRVVTVAAGEQRWFRLKPG